MSISSINNKYQNYYETLSVLQQTQFVKNNEQTDETESNKDSYISSVSSASKPIPCDTYSDIMELIKANKQANGEEAVPPTAEEFKAALEQLSGSTEETQETAASSTTTSSDSSSEDTTTVETIIGPDGTIYLKTTTTSAEGEETVTMQKIADGNEASDLFHEVMESLKANKEANGEEPAPPTNEEFTAMLQQMITENSIETADTVTEAV